jgi:hypothetical protein
LFLVGAAVAGGLVPGFVTQYRQRLGGRLDQARLDLESWQKIADQYYHGDLQRLIQYHLSSTDPTFHSEGQIISDLVATVQQLEAAVNALNGDLVQQLSYLTLHVDSGLARATLKDWVPTFSLSPEGIVVALVFALLIWLLFHALWGACAFGGRHMFGRRRPPVARAER